MAFRLRTALLTVFLLPWAASSVCAQVWIPGNQQPINKPPQSQTEPAQPADGSQPAQPDTAAAAQPSSEVPAVFPVKDKDSRLSDESRLELIRYVSGEFAKARTALPGGKKGFRVRAGQPVNQKDLISALQSNGVALSPGDDVQITKLDFRGSDIVVEINGGGNQIKSWRDRIQISGGFGGISGPRTTTSTTKTNDGYGVPAAAAEHAGITLILDFDRPLPEMTPDELKLYLSTVLDFSRQRSAAVQWTESQPPEIRVAIAAHRAEVGMDADQVIAALGRAERKVRERQPDGTDTEDWIYGQPPGKTIFVRFANDKVIRVSQYPLPVDSAADQRR
jgi:hypothetical protein